MSQTVEIKGKSGGEKKERRGTLGKRRTLQVYSPETVISVH
jgi:hypothetical protein